MGFESYISMGGRSMIVKSILTAIPLYFMSLFPLSKKVANQLKTLQCTFLWGGNVDSKKTTWVKWDDICKTKKEGGLGVKNLQFFNQALLSKWVWRFLKNESLWARTIRARHGDILLNHRGQLPISEWGCKSSWWAKILATMGKVGTGWFWSNLFQRLGDGNNISFWNDCWVGDKLLRELFPRLYHLSTNIEGKVCEKGFWNNAR